MKNFATIVFSLALSAFIYSCGEPSTKEAEKADAGKSTATTIVNLKTIAGKSIQEVEAVLGKAESTEKASPSDTPCKENPCDKAFYQSGKFEIIYINGKADWITINNVSDHELNDKNIELLGLPASAPAFNNAASVIRWEAVEGINTISFFNNGSGKIDYVNIKTATK
jgi:hypothetical protein